MNGYLLAAKGYNTRETVLTCYGGSGFTEELKSSNNDHTRLADLNHIYQLK